MDNNITLYVIVAAFVVAIGLVAYRRNPAAILSELKAVAEMAVAALEQTMPGATGEEKLGKAIEWIMATGKFGGISDTIIRMAIEAAVKVIKYSGITFSPGAMLDDIQTDNNPTDVHYSSQDGQ